MASKKLLIKNPSAWLPIAMSLTALIVLLGHVAIFGFTQEADEGISAHLFQILMAGQIPIIFYFVVRFLPRNPKQGLLVLAFQSLAIIVTCAPLYILEHSFTLNP